MNKTQLKDFLESRFNIVLENELHKDRITFNKQCMNIQPNTNDDKCYVTVADFICMNRKSEKFYFCLYGKKNTTMKLDEKTNTISIRLENNVIKRNMYDSLFRKIKKPLQTSKSYVVFFTNGDVENHGSKKIIICNELSIDPLLSKYYDK